MGPVRPNLRFKERTEMILGLGSDLIDIRRVEKTLERFGDRFTMRCFTDIERRKSDRRAQRAASYAKRFAANRSAEKGRPLARLGRRQLAERQADHGSDPGCSGAARGFDTVGNEGTD